MIVSLKGNSDIFKFKSYIKNTMRCKRLINGKIYGNHISRLFQPAAVRQAVMVAE